MLRGNAQYLTSFLIVKRTHWALCQYSRLYRNLLGYRKLVAADHPIGIEKRFSSNSGGSSSGVVGAGLMTSKPTKIRAAATATVPDTTPTVLSPSSTRN